MEGRSIGRCLYRSSSSDRRTACGFRVVASTSEFRTFVIEKAIVISTHILEEVGAVCTRAIIIAGGKVLADATPKALERPGMTLEQVFRDLTMPAAEAA